VKASDVIRIARRRAGLSQQALADRLGSPQPTIARWETGVQQPTFAAVRDVARTCGLELTLGLAARDTSYGPQVIEQLGRSSAERVRRLSPAGSFDRVELMARLAAAGAQRMIVVGEVAGALHGWPLMLDGNVLELVPHPAAVHELEATLDQLGARPAGGSGEWRLADGGRAVVSAVPPGTTGFRDLHRDAGDMELTPGVSVSVASLVDLLRMADAGRAAGTGIFLPALWTTLEVTRKRAGVERTACGDPGAAAELLDAWLNRQSR
jgi:transcriptional regulator with XRE-family HTH domain